MSNSEDIDIDDDEPVWWDVLEEQYGRPLTEAELIKEIKASYEEEFLELTDEELQDDLKRQREWMAYKQEAAVKQEKDALTKSCAKTAADDLWSELCNPPIDEHGDLSSDGYERWVDNVNRVIKERIDFHSILEIMRKAEEIGISRQAAAQAVKRHSENHAIRDEIYAWLDANLAGC